jgi:hypothetical protein
MSGRRSAASLPISSEKWLLKNKNWRNEPISNGSKLLKQRIMNQGLVSNLDAIFAGECYENEPI